MNTNRLLVYAGALGMIAVLCGAFGSHALQARLSPALLGAWRTGVEYHFYHTLAIFACGFLPPQKAVGTRPETWFLLGILLFCGSLYTLALASLFPGLSVQFIGLVTPFGGLSFLTGWLMMLRTGLKNRVVGGKNS